MTAQLTHSCSTYSQCVMCWKNKDLDAKMLESVPYCAAEASAVRSLGFRTPVFMSLCVNIERKSTRKQE